MKIYLVGGAIRDELLQLPIKDKDWVVVGSTPKIMLHLGYQKVGSDFPVFINPSSKDEYALARTERKSGKGYKGFVTFFDPQVTIEDDLIRRDLTINAIARNHLGDYIDPYGGYKDLKLKILRHISESFTEDPLRILRVARFAAYLSHIGFKIAKKTMLLMKTMVIKGSLKELTPERVWKETEKAMSTLDPYIYIKILHKCKALNILFFKIKILQAYRINRIVQQLIRNLKFISSITTEVNVRCATVLYSLTKSIELSEQYKISIILTFCKKFRIPNDIRDLSILAIKCEILVRNNLQEKKEKVLVTILDFIDAWRKPHRIKQIYTINLAYSFNTTNIDKYYFYFRKNILIKAFQEAIKVNIKSIIKEGFYGSKIKKEIKKRRVQAIKHWQDTLI